MNSSSCCWRDYLLPWGPAHLKMLQRQKWWVLISQCKKREVLPGYTWLLWALLYCHHICDRARQVSPEQHHPPVLKNASSKNRRVRELNTKDFILRRSQVSLHAVIPSILQAAERQGANAGEDRESPPGCAHPEQLTLPHWQQLSHFTARAECFQGGKQNYQFNRKHLCSQWRKTEWLTQIPSVLIFKNCTFPNVSIPQAESPLAGKL